MRQKPRSDGLRLTKVGLWFLLFALIVSLAATNTGNNGLYLVIALMAALLVVAHFVAAANVGKLGVEIEPPFEVFANSPAHFGLTIRNLSRWLPRWWLVAGLEPQMQSGKPQPGKPQPGKPQSGRERGPRRTSPVLITALPARGQSRGDVELLLESRGRHRVGGVHVSSLFPLGFFHKGARYPVEAEMLVYPEIFGASTLRPEQRGRAGEEPTRRAGWGHELLSLRPYRHGDDPRAIHWKHSARTGELIFTERENEETRRLSIVFDNAVGEQLSPGERGRFERLVSEAATAALDHLARGFEVALLTREGRLEFGGGPRQRRRILETLALVEPVARSTAPIGTEKPHGLSLRLGMTAPLGVAA